MRGVGARAALTASLLACCLPLALAAPCDVDAVQALFAVQPRPMARIESMLADCAAVAGSDYRVDMLRGVAARDAGLLDAALAALRHAHALAPHETAPALELAVAYEWHGDSAQAGALYDAVLAVSPASRPALLGAARVARQQGRLDDAQGIYEGLLAGDPVDGEARDGLGWLALDRKQFVLADTYFQRQLQARPDDQQARDGLAQTAAGWRYQLDAGISSYDLAAGNAYGGWSQLQVALNQSDTLSLGYVHHTRELPVQDPNDRTPLPSNAAHIGFERLLAGRYHWGVDYEYRQRDAARVEHRLELNGGAQLSPDWRWYGGVRQAFGAPWLNRLWYAGMTKQLDRRWSASATGYFGQSHDAANSKAVMFDLVREGPGRLQHVFGVGYNFDVDSVIVHGRFVYPFGRRHALLFGIEHRSFGHETEASLGWRINWQ